MRQVAGETMGLRVLDIGTLSETTGIAMGIGGYLRHKTEQIGDKHLDSDAQMKQHT